jgi:GNAT superfamily N-acetyltransferase
MQVRKLDTSRKRERQQFVDFVFDLYRDAPLWVPPLYGDSLKILDRTAHPYYEHSDADFFVVESEGQTLGRMAMLENRNFNRHKQTKAAFFGYFEVIEDIEVARALLKTAVEWARGRGLDTVLGPRGVIGIDGSVLVDGFEHRPAIGIPWNYPYYDAFILDSGFEKDTDYLSGYAKGNHEIPPRLYEIAAKVKEKRGFWIKTFKSKAEIKEWIPKAMEIHRQAMSTLHTYYPPTEAETRAVINSILTIIDPSLIKLVMKGDEVAGFILAYHDVSAGLQKARGRLFPFGWAYILRDRQQTEWCNVNGLGLLPQYRGLGANALLYTELRDTVAGAGFKHVDVVQVNESNFNSRSDMETMGVSWYKRHRHYKKAV